MAHTGVSATTRDVGPDTAGKVPVGLRGVSRLRSLDRRGASAVEFALVLPLLMVLLTGIIQFGWVFFIQFSMENAAREGARQLAVGAVNVAGSSSCPATSGSAT